MKGKHAHPSRNYLYVLLLALSCVLAISGYLVYHFLEDTIPKVNETGSTTVTTTVPTTTISTTTTTVFTDASTTAAQSTATVSTTAKPTTTKNPASSTTTTTASKTKISFPETLFIGDSRTHGLSLYGKISDADFFAYTSFSSFSILKKTMNISGLGEVTLEQLMSAREYKTVYIMLGINEIGSNIDTIVSRYQTLIDKVKEKQPSATIIVQSTLHVREDKQTSSISNSRINTLNEKLAGLADNATVYFLDVNPVFDNENGAMDKKYSGDGVHFYSKYYLLWRDFLINNRVV